MHWNQTTIDVWKGILFISNSRVNVPNVQQTPRKGMVNVVNERFKAACGRRDTGNTLKTDEYCMGASRVGVYGPGGHHTRILSSCSALALNLTLDITQNR